jgi:hypothetical protein
VHREYEQDRVSSSTAVITRNQAVEPGQSSRSAALRRPQHPIASGLVQRKLCGACRDGADPAGEDPGAALAGELAAVQRKAGQEPDPESIHRLAAHGTSGAGSGLPFLEQIQRAFGDHDVSNVQAHIGGPAADACQRMAANAYATGNHVAFRDAPDLHTAAHEAAHVVQQRAGVRLPGGVGQVGDEYERNADLVADAVVAGRSAEALLGGTRRSGPTAERSGGPERTSGSPPGQESASRTASSLQNKLSAVAVESTPCPRCQRGDCECSSPGPTTHAQPSIAHEGAHVEQPSRRDGGPAVQRAPDPNANPLSHANPSLPNELPPSWTCSLIFGDKLGPQLRCKDLPKPGKGLPKPPTVTLPIDPRKYPELFGDLLKKVLPKPTHGAGPGQSSTPIVIPLPDAVMRTLCARDPVLCPPKKTPANEAPSNQVPDGFHLKLDTVRVVFQQGRPKKTGDSAAQAFLAGGGEQLNHIVERLKADPRLSVQLIGNSSMEGAADVNIAVSTRRVQMVFRVLAAAGRSHQVFTPPLTFDPAAAGCNAVGLGQWSCGESKANEQSIEPHDRNVLITFFRFEEFKSKPTHPPFGFPSTSSSPAPFLFPPGLF